MIPRFNNLPELDFSYLYHRVEKSRRMKLSVDIDLFSDILCCRNDCSYRYSICDLFVTSIIQEGRLQFVEFIKFFFIVILQAQMFWQLHYKRKTLEKGGVDLGVGPYQ